MAETRRKFDHDFWEGAVRLARETGKPAAQVARDLGINPGTLVNWVNADKRRRGEGNGALPVDFPDGESMRISHEAICQALYVQGLAGDAGPGHRLC
jgi:transposase